MLNRESSRLELIQNDIRCNPNTIHNDSALSKQKITPPIKNVFPVFITSEVVIANMEI